MDVRSGFWWLANAAVGLLVFMIGVSVCFESLALGLPILAGSFLLVPGIRSRFQAATGVYVTRGLLVVLLAASLVTPGLVFEDRETGTYFGTDEPVRVEVTYEGEWRGELESRTSYRSIRGAGNATYTVRENSGLIEVSASKQNGDGGTLRLAIRVGDEVEAVATAGPDETEVSVEHSIPVL